MMKLLFQNWNFLYLKYNLSLALLFTDFYPFLLKVFSVNLPHTVVPLMLQYDGFALSDCDIRPDFSATIVQPVIVGPQQKDQLHGGERCRRERVLAAAGYTLCVFTFSSLINNFTVLSNVTSVTLSALFVSYSFVRWLFSLHCPQFLPKSPSWAMRSRTTTGASPSVWQVRMSQAFNRELTSFVPHLFCLQ